ncbi:MAG: DEAD/DEAH box helicase [Patescibacteria group bacterium]
MYKQRRRGFNPQRTRFRSFDPRTVIGKITGPVSAGYEIKNSFSDFPLNEELARNVASRKFDKPTPIQDQAILEILAGRDVVGVANTGTGKTAAFLIPLINKVILNRGSKVLIIAPTRELAVQIDKEFQIFSRGLRLYSTVCIGGVSIRGQINKLQRGPHFVIGTPGRLLDLENQKKINFGTFDSIVLDEVDRMLDMGFIVDIKKIILKLPQNRQSLFFAATLDESVKSVMRQFIVNPVMISVKTADASANVYQDVIDLKGRDKADALCTLLGKEEVSKTLIFMRTKRSADKLQTSLLKNGFQTAVLHGNKSQNQRQRSLEQFTLGRVNILIATDVASRGLDVTDISHVINYDLPESYDTYIHRIGRTGRADKKGIALTFIG